MASYRSLTNQILIFGILDLNFQSEFQQYAGSSLASSFLLCDSRILTGAATCSKGFVTYFLKVPLACLGSKAAAAVQPNSLGTLRKHLT